MISKISRAACLAELTFNPKSFFNCPDLQGGVPDVPEDRFRSEKSRLLDAVGKRKALQKTKRSRSAKNAEEEPSPPAIDTLERAKRQTWRRYVFGSEAGYPRLVGSSILFIAQNLFLCGPTNAQ
jgi:hypothetical protein